MVNITLFSHVTLIRQQQSTSDLDHFHARGLSCSRVKSCDDPISNCPVDSTVPYSPMYTDALVLTSYVCRFQLCVITV